MPLQSSSRDANENKQDISYTLNEMHMCETRNMTCAQCEAVCDSKLFLKQKVLNLPTFLTLFNNCISCINYSKLHTFVSMVTSPTAGIMVKQGVQLWNPLLPSNLTRY
jgi:hypothetical protein